MKKQLLLACTSTILLGCSPRDVADAVRAVSPEPDLAAGFAEAEQRTDAWLAENREGLELQIKDGALRLSCPGASDCPGGAADFVGF